MARKAIAKDLVVKLIVGAGQASPSPPVGPALGSKGVKSIDFCKVSPVALPPFSLPRSNSPLGIQRSDCPYDARHTNPRSSHGSPRPFIPFRIAHAYDIVFVITGSECEGDQGESERGYVAWQRERWGGFAEAYLRYCENKAKRTQIEWVTIRWTL